MLNRLSPASLSTVMPQAGGTIAPATALQSRVPAAGGRHRDVLMSDEGSGLPVHLTQMSTPRMLRAPHLTGSPPPVAGSAVPVVATPHLTIPLACSGADMCMHMRTCDTRWADMWWLGAVIVAVAVVAHAVSGGRALL